jgi:hypothetical protein
LFDHRLIARRHRRRLIFRQEIRAVRARRKHAKLTLKTPDFP